MFHSAQSHTGLPSPRRLTVDHQTTFETHLPTWLQLGSETLPSGGQRAETLRRALSYLQSLEPSSMKEKKKENIMYARESRNRVFESALRTLL